MRGHTKRELPLLLCTGARCRNNAAHDLRHGVLRSGNNDAPLVGVDDNSIKTTAASEERVHGAVGSDLARSMIAEVRYDDAFLAIPRESPKGR